MTTQATELTTFCVKIAIMFLQGAGIMYQGVYSDICHPWLPCSRCSDLSIRKLVDSLCRNGAIN